MASTPSKPGIDPKLIRQLADILNDTELTEIEVAQGELHIRVARELPAPVYTQAAPMAPATAAAPAAPPAPVAAAPSADPAPAAAKAANAVNSPMVGTVYLRPNPDADNFVKPGQSVKEGDTILLIEAMKTFNPITAPRSGKIGELLVSDAQPVEYGEPLFTLI
ncbi:MAG TPA: acetyl-CoA carboxylase biotin carboxyl carrier protein [Oceanicaulis sp.]|jgi:acetyl-CoA carboxylase biotin carboxyl carrier protein|uniref:Biotin carboxyl carrier protein of acetyl-CoA carboxylase n=1 Tax=Glycocaulis albus TaxID=1382801 RepID=A0ABQ1XRM4_9PROT|nr:acetyl-CoA carboxylase biotin carboxyl carrier protein [Glycocaulis albus]GGH01002.1 acetyl-CoA carboxylase biotin carboxyl carrier protein subunit [Glycocaulis albus]HCY57198.1 acetyl-CoA carboxylase biotin carboxyl carrier protein [Oceanicaulis sp.]